MNSKPLFFGKYKAVFFLPLGINKTLDKDGWVFVGTQRLNSNVLDFLASLLNLVFSENYLGMDRYTGENIQATVVYDDEGNIEHIAFQVYDEDTYKEFKKAFISSDLRESCELFIPD